ncbi:ABC transporter ATP-binding protein [Streptomyces sp. NPDC052051]|uniref:ABC transporter ATP-binding protein n=1 Tax=Streptomyces sp. NPDC052051 TaxID=3154649 RepID=UPI003425D066
MVLTVEHVAKRYGSRVVLRDVSLRVGHGQLVGVVGENGTGKTTLLRILSGDLRADAGAVHIDGTLGYCPQYPVLDEELTPRQHLRLFQIAYRLPGLDRAESLFRELGLTPYDRQPVKTLSGGTRQKLNLIVALIHDPEVLLLDEPYQGFDWETYMSFWDIAHRLREVGRTVVIVSHLAYDTHRLDALYRLGDGRLHLAPATGAQE